MTDRMAHLRAGQRIFVFSLTAMLAIGNHPEVSIILPVAEGVPGASRDRHDPRGAGQGLRLDPACPGASAIAARGRVVIDDMYRRPSISDR
jgi:hypothetical protein